MAQMMEAMQNFDFEKMMELIPPEMLEQIQQMAMQGGQN